MKRNVALSLLVLSVLLLPAGCVASLAIAGASVTAATMSTPCPSATSASPEACPQPFEVGAVLVEPATGALLRSELRVAVPLLGRASITRHFVAGEPGPRLPHSAWIDMRFRRMLDTVHLTVNTTTFNPDTKGCTLG